MSMYRLEMKADWPDPAGPSDETPDDETPLDDNVRQWAGDRYTEGDESDPLDAFGVLTAADDSEAWLERRADGTLIGWVRDARDDSVYRYTDVEAWAEDVDGAGMSRVNFTDSDAEAGEHTESVDDAREDGAPDDAADAEDDAAADPAEEQPPPDSDIVDATDDSEVIDDPATSKPDPLTTDADADTDPDELAADEPDFFTNLREGKKGTRFEGKALAYRIRRA